MSKKEINFETLVKSIMQEYEKDGMPVTKEEAEEVARMEMKAGKIKNYVSSQPKKKTATKRAVKIDPVKKDLIIKLKDFLTSLSFTEITIINEQREVSFNIDDDNYSVTLIKHNKKK